MAAKRTSDLIPLCHPLMIGAVSVNFRLDVDYIEIEAQVDIVDRTGVEMEALTACTVAALTIYDMCKSNDRAMVIGEIALWEKTGGRSGVYRRDARAISPTVSIRVQKPTNRRISECLSAHSDIAWRTRGRGESACGQVRIKVISGHGPLDPRFHFVVEP
jgi:hypothetical protein